MGKYKNGTVSRQSRAKKKTPHMTFLPCEGFVRVFR